MYSAIKHAAYTGSSTELFRKDVLFMKDPYDLLRGKEQEILRVKRQIEALKIAARLLDNQEDEDESIMAEVRRPGKAVGLP